MRWLFWAEALVAAALVAAPAQAETGCLMQAATYVDTTTGLTINFRPAEPWEQVGMVKHVMEATLPDGQVLWGEISENMGTSRDEGRLFAGCPRPGPDDEWPTEEAQNACRAWEGVVYAIEGGIAGFTPAADEPAPETLLFADLGRQLRYAVYDGPEGEPWDQLVFSACRN